MTSEKEVMNREIARLASSVGELHLEESEEILQRHLEIKGKAVSDIKAERTKLNEI